MLNLICYLTALTLERSNQSRIFKSFVLTRAIIRLATDIGLYEYSIVHKIILKTID